MSRARFACQKYGWSASPRPDMVDGGALCHPPDVGSQGGFPQETILPERREEPAPGVLRDILHLGPE